MNSSDTDFSFCVHEKKICVGYLWSYIWHGIVGSVSRVLIVTLVTDIGFFLISLFMKWWNCIHFVCFNLVNIMHVLATIWLKYCRRGLKHKSINQSIILFSMYTLFIRCCLAKKVWKLMRATKQIFVFIDSQYKVEIIEIRTILRERI